MNFSASKQTALKLVVLLLAVMSSSSLRAQTSPISSSGQLSSFTETSPQFVEGFLRHRNFYGDSRTISGGLLERSYITGDWGGLRDDLTDRGIYTYFGMTQFSEGAISGGNNNILRGNGSVDYSMWIDTGKAGLWSDGALFVHGETSFGTSKNGDMGSLIPSNFDATMPDGSGPATALSEYYWVQKAGEKNLVLLGKMPLGSWADTNIFANNWRYQFASGGLINNLILGSFTPYTTYAASFVHFLSPEFWVVYTMNTPDSIATQAGFDTIYNSDVTHSILWASDYELFGKPGRFTGSVLYTSNELTDFAIDPRLALGEIIGTAPIQQVNGNYCVVLSGSRYLATWDSGHEPSCELAPSRPLGWGYFWRYGWSPADRNVFTHFASFGLAGYGGPFGRIYDNYGIGWAGANISSDLRNAVSLVTELDPWDHTFETFYNARLTPSTYLSFHIQVTESTVESTDTAVGFITRLQTEF